MSQVEIKEPFMSADFGEQGGRYEWKTADEVLIWMDQLLDQWSWVAKYNNKAVQEAGTKISVGLTQSRGKIVQAQSNLKKGLQNIFEGQLAEARLFLETFIKQYPWLLPGNSQRQFVEEVLHSGKKLEARLLIANWMNVDLNGAPVKQVVSILVQWELYERGIKDRFKSESSALKRLVGEMQTSLTEYKESERMQTARFEGLHSQITDQSSKQQSDFVAAQTTRDAAWQAKIEKTQQELDALKDVYDKHMSLAAPVEYWEKKRKSHGRWTAVSFVAIVVCMILVGYVMHGELQSIGKTVEANNMRVITTQAVAHRSTEDAAQTKPEKHTAPALPIDPDGDNAKFSPLTQSNLGFLESAATWKIGSFVLLATLCFWFIRLLVRIFLSNLHLENDASERVTMVKTYLAFIRDGGLPKGESISTVLAALFRPTGDGIVKDEGLPPTAMEWITKLGGK